VREGKLHWKVSDNLLGLKLSRSILGPKDRPRQAGRAAPRRQEDHAAVLEQMKKLEVDEVEVNEADLEGASPSPTSSTPAPVRSCWRPTKRSTRRFSPSSRTPRARWAASRSSSPSGTRSAHDVHDVKKDTSRPRGGAHRDLPAHAPGRSLLPGVARATAAGGRHALGRRAADARGGARADAPPGLLLLDEPSLGLAPLVVREIFRILRTIIRPE